jgi:osmotically-inducible protein OsmY
VCGCGGDDTDRLARIGRKTLARCDAVTAGLRERVSSSVDTVRTTASAQAETTAPPPAPVTPFTPPASVATTPIDARVLWRIRWDKSLAGADVQVETPSGGVVHLKGIVNDLTRQRRAIDLAESTEGVDKVVNELGLKQPQ